MMRNTHQQKKLVTYGRSSRTRSQGCLSDTSGATILNTSSKGASPRSQAHLTSPFKNNHEYSLRPSITDAESDTLIEPSTADRGISDNTFASPSVQERSYQRKRKKSANDEHHLAFGCGAGFQHLSDSGNSVSLSNHKALSKSLAAPTNTASGRATATRTRLVDSLGIMERSVEETSPSNTLTSITPHSSPIQRKNLNTYTHGNSDGSQLSASSSSAHLGNSRITYARERSFLNDRSVPSGLGSQSSSDLLRENHRPKRSRSSPRNHLYADDEENIDSGSVRGLHELRRAGENARFRSAVDLIFDDIDDALNSKCDPCNGFAQLCTKLLDPDSVRCFSDCGFEKRFLQCVKSDLDTLSASFAICAYELIRSGDIFSRTLLAPFLPTLLGLSTKLIHLEEDMLSLVANHQSFAASRASQRVFPKLAFAIYGGHAAVKITPRIIGLRCIQSTLPIYHETGDSTGAIRDTLLRQLISLLMREFPESLDDFPLQPERYQVLVLILSILEVLTIPLGPLANGYRDIYQPLSRLSNILDMSGRFDDDQYRHILVLSIKVVLNTTNSDSSLCEAFSTPGLVNGLVNITKREFEQVIGESLPKEDSLDAVILALGTLINLTEKCESSRAIFIRPTHNSSTPLKLLLILFSTSIGSIPEVG